MVEDPGHDAAAKVVPAVLPAAGEPRPPAKPPSPGIPALPGAAAVRLAVCPCCRTVWELDPIFPESVKLMICWRCAEQHAHGGLSAAWPPAPEPPPRGWPGRRWTLVGAGAALASLALASLFVDLSAWVGKTARAPRAAGVVTDAASIRDAPGTVDAAAVAAAAQAVAHAERVLAQGADTPASAVPVSAAPHSVTPAARPGMLAARPGTAAARPRTPAPARPGTAPPARPDTPARTAACTSGAAALGLCSAPPNDEGPP